MKKFKASFLLFLAPLIANADCLQGKKPEEVFSREHVVTKSGNCVGVRYEDHPKVTVYEEGDLLWLNAAGGPEKRIAGAPFKGKFVATDNGVLYAYQVSFDELQIRFWDMKKNETTVCNEDEKKRISPRDVNQGRIKLHYDKAHIQVGNDTSSITYYEGCRDTANMSVLVPLTEADRQVLEQYGPGGQTNNLTDPERAKALPDILGRESELSSVVGALKSTNIRSSMLIGPAGVGKTAIAYLLAKRIVEKHESIPDWLRDYSIYEITLGSLSGEGYAERGQKKMMELLKAATGKKVILLMDEFHQINGMGSNNNANGGISQLMKTGMADGRLAIIATMTDNDDDEMTDDALMRRFNLVHVKQPSDKDLMVIFKGYAKKLEKNYRVSFSEEMIVHLLDITKQHIRNEFHPGLGIKIMDALASKLDNEYNRDNGDIDLDDRTMLYPSLVQLKHQIGEQGDIASLKQAEEDEESFSQKVDNFLETVKKQYIGNPMAIEALHMMLKKVKIGFVNPDRPAGVILFLGPSGVGKTYLAELFAKTMGFKYKEFPMNTMNDESDLNSFLGSPPGYVGYSASGGALSKWIKENPESVINFDEVEKANDAITEALLQLMDKGVLTDRSDNTVNFQNGYIILTSNFGLDLISDYDRDVLGIEDPDYDFKKKVGRTSTADLPETPEDLAKLIKAKMIAEKAFGQYTEAFVGRIDQFVIFNHFDKDQQKQVADLEIKKVLKRAPKVWRDKVIVGEDVKKYIYDHGFDFDTGARSARGLAESFLVEPITNVLIAHYDPDKGDDIVSVEVRLKGLNRGEPEAYAILIKKDITGKVSDPLTVNGKLKP